MLELNDVLPEHNPLTFGLALLPTRSERGRRIEDSKVLQQQGILLPRKTRNLTILMFVEDLPDMVSLPFSGFYFIAKRHL